MCFFILATGDVQDKPYSFPDVSYTQTRFLHYICYYALCMYNTIIGQSIPAAKLLIFEIPAYTPLLRVINDDRCLDSLEAISLKHCAYGYLDTGNDDW